MTFIEKITQDLNEALKAKSETTVSTLRFLIAQVHNARIAKGEELSDEEILVEIAKDAKRHRESIEAFQKGGREDLVSREKAQLEVLERYLPQQLSSEELLKMVEEAIFEIGASGPGDMGRVMSAVMGKVKGQADGARVSELVKQKLG